MARKLEVEIVGDARSLERAFARSSRSASTFNRNIERGAQRTTRVFGGLRSGLASLGVLGAGAGIAVGVKAAVDAASELNEQQNRSRVLFGKSSAAIVAWSETTANALGLSSAAALEGAGNFGAMFETIGLADRQASGMSKRLVTLAADMASFNNQDPSEMLDRLRSGLAGEAEPLRRFGVLLSEARVQQEAYRSGLAKVGAKLTEQQKVQARYNLILRDAGVQVGDFARTADSWANVQRRLAAILGDTAANIGQALLPALEKYGGQLADWLSKEKNQQRIIDTTKRAVEGLTEGVRIATRVVGYLSDEWGEFMGIIDAVRQTIERFRIWLNQKAIQMALDFVEPFTHIPFRFFDWAREAKTGWLAEMEDLNVRMRAIGDDAGAALSEGVAAGFSAREGPEGGFRKIVNEAVRKVARPAPVADERVRRGLTAAQRNQFFDARLVRQLDRLQDLSLRKQLGRLREIARAIRERLAATSDITRRLNLEDKLLDVLRQQRSVQQQIGDEIRVANAALKERADAIKSALIERFQQRQTKILNERALRDAREQLWIARQIGGPKGIRAATRELQDVRFDILRARLEAAPATLTAGGRFQLGGVITINIHGVTDPDVVARKVAAILQRRRRRTTTQTRGPAPAGA